MFAYLHTLDTYFGVRQRIRTYSQTILKNTKIKKSKFFEVLIFISHCVNISQFYVFLNDAKNKSKTKTSEIGDFKA
jgi:hypothetical protein